MTLLFISTNIISIPQICGGKRLEFGLLTDGWTGSKSWEPSTGIIYPTFMKTHLLFSDYYLNGCISTDSIVIVELYNDFNRYSVI